MGADFGRQNFDGITEKQEEGTTVIDRRYN
jgi:hypothetical protein